MPAQSRLSTSPAGKFCYKHIWDEAGIFQQTLERELGRRLRQNWIAAANLKFQQNRRKGSSKSLLAVQLRLGMDALPSGIVTFCFTDIEEPAQHATRLGDRYAALLEEHRHLIRAAAAEHGGIEIKCEGDSCYFAFQDANAAVKAAGDMQHTVDNHGWPADARIRIRIGVHTLEVQPSGIGYDEQALHQVSTIAESGHGGQIAVSEQTAIRLNSEAIAPYRVTRLGKYRLRNFERPCRLFQVAGPGLVASFPSPRAHGAARKRLRIFLSSPRDVKDPREIAAQTIERLAKDYARYFKIEPYLWESEALVASEHPQDSIEPPSEFDIVVLILWSRLGTSLPPRTAVREYHGIDGRTPVTGTEWEYEDALKAAKEAGVPDLLVYRSCKPAPVDLLKADVKTEQLQQFAQLETFWSRHFVNQGIFLGAFTEFATNDEFAERVEAHLRALIEKRKEAEISEHVDDFDIVWTSDPFRGLEAFEYEHASIYFGQDEALSRAMLQLSGNARDGLPFLLISGGSGSGKSSLVKAGIVPKLFVPRRISDAWFLRRVTFRPSDPGEDVFDALARKLAAQVGEQEGLSELVPPGQPISALAQHLRHATTQPAYPIGTALAQIGSRIRRDGRPADYANPKLVLVIDQLEELYTTDGITLDDRRKFIDLIGGLARSGLVWVVATMRNDFWHRADETPELVRMSEGNGRLELLPPNRAQLAQMIRRPAIAAGVVFESHTTTDIPLDDVIAEEVAREPGALPLLSYLLDQLFRKDVLEQRGRMLTYATYKDLGKLEGAIATRAEAILRHHGADSDRVLGSVLFSLVRMGTSEGDVERVVARRVPLSTFPPDTPERQLVDDMLNPDARLLVSDAGSKKSPTIRIAHEALIRGWERAREFVQNNAEALRMRNRIEDRYMLWSARRNSAAAAGMEGSNALSNLLSFTTGWRRLLGHEEGLLSDFDLVDGQRLLRTHRAQTDPHLVEFIEHSVTNDRNIRGRAFRIMTFVACAVTALAILAFVAAREAQYQVEQTLQAQSRLLTKVADDRLKNGDINGAEDIPEVFANLLANPVDRAAAVNVFLELRASDTQLAGRFLPATGFNSAAYSPDDKHIVTTSDDGTARVLDADTGVETAILSGHEGPVIRAFYSPNSRHIVTSSVDTTARIWDAQTGRQTGLLKGHSDVVNSATWSPDGGRIVTTSNDKSVRIWDTKTGAQIMTISDPGGAGSYAAYSPDGKHIVTASLDKTVRIWDAQTGAMLVALSGHGDSVGSAVYSPDGNRIVTASNDRTARIWDARTGAQLDVLRGHTDYVMSAAFSPDGERIVTASKDKTVRIWNASTGDQLAVLFGHGGAVSSAVYSPDGKRIVTTSEDHTMRVWTTGNTAQLGVLAGHTNTVTFAAFSPDGKRVVTASDDQTARIWDAASNTTLQILSGHDGPVLGAAFSPGGQQVVTGSNDTTARIWDVETGSRLKLLTGHTEGVTSVAYSRNGKRIATSSYDKTARIWDSMSGKPLVTLSGHGDVVESVAFSPDDKFVVTASDDKTARIWDAATGAQLVVLSGHGNIVEAADYSPDGKYIVTASFDKTARIWDAKSGELLRVLSGHDGDVESAAFSPDNRYVVTASDDKTVRIWDAITGVELEVLAGHGDKVNTAAYAPDGRRIVSASADRTARIWSADLPLKLDTQITWLTAAEFEILSRTERAELGLPPDTRIRNWTNNISACDRDAGAPYDPDRGAPGTVQEQISGDVARVACIGEIATSGGSPRAIYELGRALLARGDPKGARRQFELAISKGDRAARIDLANLLADASSGASDPRRAVALYERAWNDDVPIAAFELGRLYEGQERGRDAAAIPCAGPGSSKASRWYRAGADAGEPTALARLAECEERFALLQASTRGRNALLLLAFSNYAAAAERAHNEDWPEDAWKGWRYRRATLARLLARDGMMQQVADAFGKVRDTAHAQPQSWLAPIGAWWQSF